ncbi:MAG: NYN domain-containing protein [Eggerthellaceae bacterium]
MARKRNKLLIVDGYNVLRSGQRYVHMRRQDDYTVEKYNNVREALISDVAAFAGSEYRAIIVFDGADNPESAGKTQRVGGIKIMFSPFGSSADKVIEKLAHDAREQHVEVMVVTSDASIQDAVFGGGVDRMSANGFSLEMDDLSEDARIDSTTQVSQKNTVADRLNPDVLAKLQALRDGK